MDELSKVKAERDELIRLFFFLTKACEKATDPKEAVENVIKIGQDVIERFFAKLGGGPTAKVLMQPERRQK
jgi:hypothetical protein